MVGAFLALTVGTSLAIGGYWWAAGVFWTVAVVGPIGFYIEGKRRQRNVW